MDYCFYRDVYRGSSIEPEQWPEYSARATDYIRRLKRLYRVSGEEDMAVCAVADAVCFFTAAQNADEGAVYYASVGSVSMSGKGVFSQIDLSPAAQEREFYRCAGLYLDIYRGVGQC